uniref:Copper transport protein n=1 Tax=Phallusia mammillata TaxID=59560 RepID=A0A6F9DS00_9ASCI|nr:high affinity copper uptake protein 1-like [Phallusia mammillata]
MIANGTKLASTYFSFELPFHVMFFEWFVDSERELVWSCARVFIMAAFYEGMKVLRTHLHHHAHLSMRAKTPCAKQLEAEGQTYSKTKIRLGRVFNRWHILQTMLQIMQTTLGIWLVMIYMTFNSWLAIFVSLGSAFGYFLFGWKLLCQRGLA